MRTMKALSVLMILVACCTRIDAEEIQPQKALAERYEPLILAIARDYVNYGRVDNTLRWAPMLCAAPPHTTLHYSASSDDETHGKKVYTVYAKERDDYFYIDNSETARIAKAARRKAKPDPKVDRALQGVQGDDICKQVVIKEAWMPEEAKGHEESIDGLFPAVHKEKKYKAGKFAGLFMMLQFDAATPGTDQGWIYATVADDKKTITSSGLVKNCMTCHADAPYGRLFGLQAHQ